MKERLRHIKSRRERERGGRIERKIEKREGRETQKKKRKGGGEK